MKNILLDIHFAESYSSLLVMNDTQKKMMNKNLDSLSVFYKQVLEKNHTTVAQFEEAMKWYSLHPEQLDTAYTRVLHVMDSLKAVPDDIQ